MKPITAYEKEEVELHAFLDGGGQLYVMVTLPLDNGSPALIM
jgi:hypothetical protein